MNTKQFRVRKGKDIRLSRAATRSDEAGSGKKRLRKKLTTNIGKISDLQYKLYAENRQSLLVIFQGMDSSGKDGTIKSIMNGVNPQGGRVFFCICLFFFVPSRLCVSAAMHSHRRSPRLLSICLWLVLSPTTAALLWLIHLTNHKDTEVTPILLRSIGAGRRLRFATSGRAAVKDFCLDLFHFLGIPDRADPDGHRDCPV